MRLNHYELRPNFVAGLIIFNLDYKKFFFKLECFHEINRFSVGLNSLKAFARN